LTTHVLQFLGLDPNDPAMGEKLPRVAEGDTVEMRIVHPAGDQEAASLPPEAVALIGAVLDHLARGERVAVLAENEEVSPSDAAQILGMSRPLVVHRMDVGDLPFRYVGKHRRTKVQDVLVLKAKIDEQRAALDALAEETDALMRNHGV
jgi:hypothetical protein